MEQLTVLVMFETLTSIVEIVAHLHGGVVIAVSISKEFVDELGQCFRSPVLNIEGEKKKRDEDRHPTCLSD